MPAPKEIADFLHEIEQNYFFARSKRISRMDIEWGKWSRDINLRMRERQSQSEDPVKSLLIWLFMYWINRSELLELHFKYPITEEEKKEEVRDIGREMRKVILSGDPVGLPEGAELIGKLLKDVGKEFNKQDGEAN